MPLGMLSFRDFDFDRDSKAWSDVFNVSYADWPDHVPMTPERIRWWMDAPGYDPLSMRVAELDGAIVGLVESSVDKKREERKGFFGDFAVPPEFRQRGYGRLLFQEAERSLRERGMETVEAWLWDGALPAIGLVESSGCKVVRTSALMNIPLGNSSRSILAKVKIPEGVDIRRSDLSREDVMLQNRLDNDAFREHYNFRPVHIEETEYKLFKDPQVERLEIHFAGLKGEPAGYVVTSVDRKHRELTGQSRGWILDIGVLKPYRKRGVGEALLRRGLEVLLGQGMSEAILGVDEMNQTGAFQLYKKVGFRVKSRYLAYLKTL